MQSNTTQTERKDSIPSERALLIAADPTAPVEILTALAEHENDQVGSHLAANPNTPEAVLHRLWLRFPLAILQNPILSYRSFTTGESFTKLLPSSNKLALYSAMRKEERLEEIETWFPEKERSDWFRPYWERGEVEKTIASDQLHEIDCHLATDPSAFVRRTMLKRVGRSVLHLYAKDREIEIRLALTRLLPTSAYYDKHESHFVPIADTLSTDAADESIPCRRLDRRFQFPNRLGGKHFENQADSAAHTRPRLLQPSRQTVPLGHSGAVVLGIILQLHALRLA